jgi:hypothetical protein
MSKIYEKLGLDKPSYLGLFGVEVECEGRNLTPLNNVYWRTEKDGSLRGEFPHSSCEYVLKKPIGLISCVKAVDNLLENQRKDVEFKFSFRTSVHVHVNVSDMEWEEYLAFCYTWLLCEVPLMEFCGEDRKANRFCLRATDCEGVVDGLLLLINTGSLRRVNEFEVRYAALNIGATPKYGSLEFRGMRGTLDKAVLTAWLSALKSMKEYCYGKTIRKVFEEINELGNRAFLAKVVGTDLFWTKSVDGEMDRSFSLTIQLPFAEEFE